MEDHMSFDDRVKKLLFSGNEDQAYEMLLAKDPKDLSVDSKILLATLYLKKERIFVGAQKVIELFENNMDEIVDNSLGLYALASAYMTMNEFIMAHTILLHLQKLEFDSNYYKEMLDECEEVLSKGSVDNFLARVDFSWEYFLDVTKKLKPTSRKLNSKKIMDDIQRAFDICLDDVSFSFNISNDRFRVVFIAQVDCAKLFLINCFLKQMPKEVKKYWDFSIGLPRQDKNVYIHGEVEIDGNDVLVKMIQKKDDILELEVYFPQLKKCNPMDKDFYMVSILSKAVGELTLLKYTANYYVVDKKPKGKVIKATELAEEFELLGYHEVKSIDEYLLYMNPYPNMNNPMELAPFRNDFSDGMTSCPGLVYGYSSRDVTSIQTLIVSGATAGFFAIEGELSEKQKNEFIIYLKKKVGYCFDLVGWANGKKYLYIDFIAYDLEPVLEQAEKYLKKIGVKSAIYQTFYSKAKPILLIQNITHSYMS